MGRLSKAHGLKGGLKLELYTDDPDRRFPRGATFSLQVPDSSPWADRSITLDELRWYNGHAVAFFEGISDREGAETLVKAILWIDADLDEPTGEDDAWYDHQLVGLRVLRDGVQVGTVARVDHLPAQDLLAVETSDRGEVLVPFVGAIVPEVDIDAGTVTVTPPTGLFEDPVEVVVADEGADARSEADDSTSDAGVSAPDPDETASDADVNTPDLDDATVVADPPAPPSAGPSSPSGH